MATLLTTAEVAKRLRVTVSTVNNWARANRIRAVELPGGQRRYREEDIDALIAFDAEPDQAAS